MRRESVNNFKRRCSMLFFFDEFGREIAIEY